MEFRRQLTHWFTETGETVKLTNTVRVCQMTGEVAKIFIE